MVVEQPCPPSHRFNRRRAGRPTTSVLPTLHGDPPRLGAWKVDGPAAGLHLDGGEVTQLPSSGASLAVQQPIVHVEQRIAVVGGSAVDLRRSARALPFEVALDLREPGLLTEVEVIWDQSVPFAVRFEVLVNEKPVAVQWSQVQDKKVARGGSRGAEVLQCRLQLDEPQERVQSCVLCVFANDHLNNQGAVSNNLATNFMQEAAGSADPELDGEEWIHIAEVIPRGLPDGSTPPRRRWLRPPSYWEATEGVFHRRVDVASTGLHVFQQLLDETWKGQATRDRKGNLPKRLVVRKVQRVEALPLWNRFSRARRQMLLTRGHGGACTPLVELCRDTGSHPVRTQRVCESAPELFGPCEPRANEQYLFHGTSPAGALGIIREGFDIRRAGRRSNLMFGPGAYFAEAASKSDEYAGAEEMTGLCAMLVCRVLCGEMYHALRRLDPQVMLEQHVAQKYDGVLGDREASVGTYREFVVFREDQIYPEYLVFYDRDF